MIGSYIVKQQSLDQYSKQQPRNCWGGAHTSVYLGNLWKVVHCSTGLVAHKAQTEMVVTQEQRL